MKRKASRSGYVDGAWWPRKIHVDNQLVRLDGYDRQPAHTLGVTGRSGWSVILLVVPVQTPEAEAHHAMMTAATLGDTSSVELLLAAGQPT